MRPIAVDRAVEHHRRHHVGAAQVGDEDDGLPVSVRRAGAQPLAAPAAIMATRHGRGRPGVVNEGQALGIEVELAVDPLFSALRGIGAGLLTRLTA